jgi:predicted ATP-dependent endonuclease of OLD family
MKLVKVKLTNFRCYKEETSLDLNDITVIIGKNDVGKSAILSALNIFFEEGKIDADDAHISGDKSNVRISCEFDNFPDELVIDSTFPTNLTDEFLLNENKRLEIIKVYNCELKTPKISGVYVKAVHPSKEKYNDLLQLKNPELKKRANELEIELTEVDLRTNTQIRRKIWSSVNDLESKLQEIHLDKETAKEIWSQLQNYLPTYAFFKSDRESTDQDSEAQDPLKSAVDEAIKEQMEELNKITEKVKTEVTRIAEKTVKKIKEMNEDLANELKPYFEVPKWSSVFKIKLTGDEEIPINKRGSGIRRLILLNFFRAKAEDKAKEKDSPGIIYAIEEPETSQHPNNQRMLMRAFEELISTYNTQVILTTHNPTFAKLADLKNLRFIEYDEQGNRKILSNDEAAYKKISKSLGVLPENNVKLFIGVEGIHDCNFLISYSNMLRSHGEDVPNLELMENNDEIIFFPMGGGNLIYWASRLEGLNRPEFYITDRDNPPPAQPKYQEFINEVNGKGDNCKAICTNKKEMENYIHPLAIRSVRPKIDITFNDFDDVPEMVAKIIHENSERPNPWTNLKKEKKGEKISNVKRWLNTEAIENMTPELLTEVDPDNEVRGWLNKIKEYCNTN